MDLIRAFLEVLRRKTQISMGKTPKAPMCLKWKRQIFIAPTIQINISPHPLPYHAPEHALDTVTKPSPLGKKSILEVPVEIKRKRFALNGSKTVQLERVVAAN